MAGLFSLSQAVRQAHADKAPVAFSLIAGAPGSEIRVLSIRTPGVTALVIGAPQGAPVGRVNLSLTHIEMITRSIQAVISRGIVRQPATAQTVANLVTAVARFSSITQPGTAPMPIGAPAAMISKHSVTRPEGLRAVVVALVPLLSTGWTTQPIYLGLLVQIRTPKKRIHRRQETLLVIGDRPKALKSSGSR